jgi:hypothetical protein
MGLLAAYRSTGADLPFGDPRAAHGVAMEGYFWRITDPATGRVVIALIGVNRGPRGPWATLGLAAHPTPVLAIRAEDGAYAAPSGIGAGSGSFFAGDERGLRVDLGPNARLDVQVEPVHPWPRRRHGGSSIFQSVPALNQYWHPWLLTGRATGTAQVGDEVWHFENAPTYAEKNWGREGFPDAWWWGQAHGFSEPEACVAFAGGQVNAGPLRTEVTALVVRLPDGQVVRLGNPVTTPVRARVTDETWILNGRNAIWQIDVEAQAPLGAAHVLPVPLPSERRNAAGAIEHLGGALSVTVRRRGRLVWQGHTELAGLEHGGLARASAEIVRRGGPAEADHWPAQPFVSEP